MGVVVAPIVDRRAAVADIFDIGMTREQAVEFGDHWAAFPLLCPDSRSVDSLGKFC